MSAYMWFSSTFKKITIAGAIIILSLGAAAILRATLLETPPCQLDIHHRLVLKPGRTIPSRSIDAQGSGAKYHFTRFDTYKSPDWHDVNGR
jgi:hypothetical protein